MAEPQSITIDKTTRKRKYYAVAIGANPGIYNTWPECEREIRNLPYVRYKSFESIENAREFIEKIQKSFPHICKPDEKKVYAVAVGRVPGIYFTNLQYMQQVHNLEDNKFEEFQDVQEAFEYVRKEGRYYVNIDGTKAVIFNTAYASKQFESEREAEEFIKQKPEVNDVNRYYRFAIGRDYETFGSWTECEDEFQKYLNSSSEVFRSYQNKLLQEIEEDSQVEERDKHTNIADEKFQGESSTSGDSNNSQDTQCLYFRNIDKETPDLQRLSGGSDSSQASTLTSDNSDLVKVREFHKNVDVKAGLSISVNSSITYLQSSVSDKSHFSSVGQYESYITSKQISQEKLLPYSDGDPFIGEGGCGSVLLMMYQKNKVAVKSPLRNESYNYNKKIIKNEIKILSMVHKIEDVLQPIAIVGEEMLVFRYIQPGSLSKCIKDLSIPWALKFLTDVARVMQHVHERGVAHGDLKPDNLLIEGDGKINVADFGLATIVDEDSSSECNFFSQRPIIYIAPEFLEKHSKPCDRKKKDVFAFGVIMYELVHRQRPWKDINQEQIRQRVLQGERPEISDTISSNLTRIIKRCWDQNPKKRPTFDEIYNRLSKISNHEKEQKRDYVCKKCGEKGHNKRTCNIINNHEKEKIRDNVYQK